MFREHKEAVDDLSGALLWIHVLSGVVWIGASACLAIGVAALTAGTEEFHDFAARAVPALDRVNLVAAILLAGTGITNVLLRGSMNGYSFSSTFLGVLVFKIVLFAAMAFALWKSFKAETALGGDPTTGHDEPAIKRLVAPSIAVAVLGGLAMALGVWLVGS